MAPKTCSSCHGAGTEDFMEEINCPSCSGMGRHEKTWTDHGNPFAIWETCSFCSGSRRTIAFGRRKCSTCGGSGVIFD